MFSYTQKVFESLQILFCESRFPLSSEVISLLLLWLLILGSSDNFSAQPSKSSLYITRKLIFHLCFFLSVTLLWLVLCTENYSEVTHVTMISTLQPPSFFIAAWRTFGEGDAVNLRSFHPEEAWWFRGFLY